jgi:hypothetical protein
VKAELLEREFAPRRVSNAGGLLLRSADALELIDRAAEEGVPIVAIDGVRVSAERGGSPADSPVESRAERLADFSSAVAEGHGCWDHAEAFVRERSSRGLVFGVSLGDDPIEAV